MENKRYTEQEVKEILCILFDKAINLLGDENGQVITISENISIKNIKDIKDTFYKFLDGKSQEILNEKFWKLLELYLQEKDEFNNTNDNDKDSYRNISLKMHIDALISDLFDRVTPEIIQSNLGNILEYCKEKNDRPIMQYLFNTLPQEVIDANFEQILESCNKQMCYDLLGKASQKTLEAYFYKIYEKQELVLYYVSKEFRNANFKKIFNLLKSTDNSFEMINGLVNEVTPEIMEANWEEVFEYYKQREDWNNWIISLLKKVSPQFLKENWNKICKYCDKDENDIIKMMLHAGNLKHYAQQELEAIFDEALEYCKKNENEFGDLIQCVSEEFIEANFSMITLYCIRDLHKTRDNLLTVISRLSTEFIETNFQEISRLSDVRNFYWQLSPNFIESNFIQILESVADNQNEKRKSIYKRDRDIYELLNKVSPECIQTHFSKIVEYCGLDIVKDRVTKEFLESFLATNLESASIYIKHEIELCKIVSPEFIENNFEGIARIYFEQNYGSQEDDGTPLWAIGDLLCSVSDEFLKNNFRRIADTMKDVGFEKTFNKWCSSRGLDKYLKAVREQRKREELEDMARSRTKRGVEQAIPMKALFPKQTIPNKKPGPEDPQL